MAVGVNVITRFVKAKNAEMLSRKMRKLQIQRQTHIPFFDIQYADGFWFAWYKDEITSIGLMKETKDEKNGIS